MRQEDWTTRLRDRLEHFEEVAPEGLWEDIERVLPAAPKQKKVRFAGLRRWAVAAAVAGALVVATSYLFMNQPENQMEKPSAKVVSRQPSVSQSVASSSEPTAPSSALTADKTPLLVAPLRNQSVKNLLSTAQQLVEKVADGFSTEASDLVAAAKHLAQGTDQSAANPLETAQNTAEKRTDSDASKTLPHGDTNDRRSMSPISHTDSYRYTVSRRNTGSGQLTASLFLQNGFVEGQKANNVRMSEAMIDYYSLSADESLVTASLPQRAQANETVYLTDYKEHAAHHKPVSVGINVSYHLTDRLWIETGANYTRLTSDFTQQMRTNTLQTTQRLTYIGVPLRAGYEVWKKKPLRVYGIVGGEADINVKAERESSDEQRSMNRDRVQWSVSAAAGVQVDIVPKLGLFIEPGVRYYIDNGSNVENIFKDKPLNIDLQVGVRYTVK